MKDIDEIISDVVYLIFEGKISLEDPEKTIKEIKEKINEIRNV